jgi:hypothetical protein
VVVNYLSDEQGIKTVDDLKIIPKAQMTSSTHKTLISSVAASFNICTIQSAKALAVVINSNSSSSQFSTSNVSILNMVVFLWTKLCGFHAWMDY